LGRVFGCWLIFLFILLVGVGDAEGGGGGGGGILPNSRAMVLRQCGQCR